MSIGAVVVNFFTERFLADLLGDLLGSSLIGEVVVVDNGSASAPGCPDPRVRLLSPGRNIGFAAAVNLGWGALEPGHEQVLVVNPDTRMPPASLMHLHRMACLGRESDCWSAVLLGRRGCIPATPGNRVAELVGAGRSGSRFPGRLLAEPLLGSASRLLLVGQNALSAALA